VIAKMVVGVGDQNVEHHAAPQSLHIAVSPRYAGIWPSLAFANRVLRFISRH
jgi:hypothetical protein